MSINGVEPKFDTIQKGEYPIGTYYYIVINANEAEDSSTRQLVEAMLSPRGQVVAKEAGYVPVIK
jgi:ABC-type phosphate transport system substrate-binding protein